jgi:hypothetical protein
MEKIPDPEKDMTLTVSIPPDKAKRKTALEVAKRMALISYISAAVTFLVKRVLYRKIKDLQPDGLPVTIPDHIAFPAWGAAVTGAAIAARKAGVEGKKLSRRNFFYVSGAAAGAFVGSVLADTVPDSHPLQRQKAGDMAETAPEDLTK